MNSKYSGKCHKCGRLITRCECSKQSDINILPEALEKEINDKSVNYVMPLAKTTLEGIYLAQIFKDGATEYALKYQQASILLRRMLEQNHLGIDPTPEFLAEIKHFLDQQQ